MIFENRRLSGPGLGKTTWARAAAVWAWAVLAAAGPTACSTDASKLMEDGYYTAEAFGFDAQGWKEFLTIYISDDRIVIAEYDAKNASGFLRSWDMADMRAMNAALGTYHNKYARAYTMALLNRQDPDQIQPLPGAAHAHRPFQRLAEAALAQARAGDKRVAFVDLGVRNTAEP